MVTLRMPSQPIFVILFLLFSFSLAAKYQPDAPISVFADRIGPFNNPHEFYKYFDLPFCQPTTKVGKFEGLGEALLGYELRKTNIAVQFGVPVQSAEICSKVVDQVVYDKFVKAVKNQYWYQLFIDDLPVWGIVGEVVESKISQEEYYIYSHLHFDISRNLNQIIEVNMTSENAALLEVGATIGFSYSVSWSLSETPFSRRFDKYLDSPFFEHQIHWFSLFNSFMLIIFLFGLVGMILLRTLRKDYIPIGEEDESEGITDESGWKVLHREVFRPPNKLAIFSALLGSGYQLFFSTFIILLLGYFGAQYYQSRGSLLTAFIMWNTFFSSVIAGYGSGSFYTKNKGGNWIKASLFTTFLFPLLFLSLSAITSIVARSYGALSYIPTFSFFFLTILTLVGSIMTFIGTLLGRHWGSTPNTPGSSGSFQTHHGRIIPNKPWYQQAWFSNLVSGLLPFSGIFIELYYLYTSLWHYKYYYVYGFALVIFLVSTLITMAVNVITTYFLLNNEDHRWQWRSWKSGASVGLYVFIYSLYYYFYRTFMSGFLQFLHFFSISLIFSLALAFISGSLGFYASNKFVNRIYKDLKAE